MMIQVRNKKDLWVGSQMLACFDNGTYILYTPALTYPENTFSSWVNW